MKAPLRLRALTPILTTAIAPIAWGTTYLVTTEFLPADRALLAGLLRAIPARIALAVITRSRPRGTGWVTAADLGALNIGCVSALLVMPRCGLPGGRACALRASDAR